MGSVLFLFPEAASGASVLGLAPVLSRGNRCQDTPEMESAPPHCSQGRRKLSASWPLPPGSGASCGWHLSGSPGAVTWAPPPQGACSCVNWLEERVGNLPDSVSEKVNELLRSRVKSLCWERTETVNSWWPRLCVPPFQPLPGLQRGSLLMSTALL